MDNTIEVVDLYQMISGETSPEKSEDNVVYYFRVGDQKYDITKLSVPNAFQISKPNKDNVDNLQIREFIDQHLDECLQYLEQGTSEGMNDFYEYTSQLSKDKTKVIVHAFKPGK
ncbi:MAG: hypothetical protein HFJ12_07400 [Bacilli bacterium]|nr:hypothetical protein [Bacilli bacterium]